ncbi:TetR/AcrR family transcriptional regulator [Tropicimonas sp. TH_r6]|uniref:TetR/AcrR family transcriptional regulator n=1 Tax=Tropicimonas sp. TH_r6 TaxID=3082085 RepID=UPI002953DACA|nr:TetR/AcrR family transcriptional regulator [Tropicimonas sp. TH_r6]MDV7143428.1 TetR/AcrR family transcriptional regulator [Tropicimonas sp. TH_r6]
MTSKDSGDDANAAAKASSASPANRRAAGQDPAKREQILDGAERVFTRDGFDTASMNDITREAGVSKSTIYVYFADKEELFEAALARRQDLIFNDIQSWLATDGTEEDVLMSYGCSLVQLLCSDLVIQAHHLVIGVISRKPELARMIYRGGRERGVMALKEYLDARVAEGVLEIGDTHLAAGQFIELCLTGTFRARLLAYHDSPPSEEEVRFFVGAAVEMFLKCYGTEDNQPPKPD